MLAHGPGLVAGTVRLADIDFGDANEHIAVLVRHRTHLAKNLGSVKIAVYPLAINAHRSLHAHSVMGANEGRVRPLVPIHSIDRRTWQARFQLINALLQPLNAHKR